MAKTITLQDRLRLERQTNKDPDREKDERDLLTKLTNKVSKTIPLSKHKSKKTSSPTPQDAPVDTPQGKDTGVHTGIPQDVPQDTPEKTSQNTPTDTPQGISIDTPQDIPQDIKQNAPITICANDYIFLHCLKIINGEFNSMTHICKELGKSVNTFKKVKDRLILKGLIEYHKDQYLGGLRGFKAVVINKKFQLIGNKEIADKFISKINPDDLKFSIGDTSQDIPQGTPQGISQDTSELILSKSVSINKNLLTTQIETDPDLEYWKQKDLPVKKIESWMQEFELNINQILNQLRYSAFDWQHKTEKEVQKPIGKFYTALKTGGFAKPSGYKTPEEKRHDIINAEIEEKEKLLQEIKAKNKRLKDLAYEIWLEELSSEKRKNIIGKSNLTKKQKDKGRGPAIDAVLKSYYQESVEE